MERDCGPQKTRITAVCLYPEQVPKLVGGSDIPDDEDKLDKCLDLKGSEEGSGGVEA